MFYSQYEYKPDNIDTVKSPKGGWRPGRGESSLKEILLIVAPQSGFSQLLVAAILHVVALVMTKLIHSCIPTIKSPSSQYNTHRSTRQCL